MNLALPQLETERLVLRALRESDAEGLHAAYGDAEAMRFWDFPAARNIAETSLRISQSLAVDDRWHAA